MTGAHPARVFMQTGLLRRATMAAYFPLFFVRLVTDVGLSPLQLVLLGTVMELSILLAEVPTGVVADLYSRRLSVIIAFLLGGPAVVLSAFAEQYWLLVIAQAVVGIASTFESGAETAWVTDELGSAERVEPLILRRAQWQMGATIVGIGVFSGLAALLTLTTALAVLGAVYFAWGLVLLIRMPETNFTPDPHGGWSGFGKMMRRGWDIAGHTRVLWLLVIVLFIGGLAKEAIDRLDVQRLVDIGLPEDLDEAVVIGVIVAVRSLFAAGFLVIARRRAHGRGVVLAMTLMLVGIAASVVVLAHVELLVVAALGLMFRDGLTFAMEPLVITWTNSFAPSDARATVHSFMGQAEALGEILGGIALGTVAEVFTVPTAMTLSAILFAIAAAVAFTARRQWSVTTA